MLVIKNNEGQTHMNLPVSLPQNPKLPAWRSHEPREITVQLDSGESFSFGALKSSSVQEVIEYCSEFLKVETGKLWIMRKDGRGNLKKMMHHEECPPLSILKGVKSLRKPAKQYEHPIVVVGAGLGGCQCMIDLKKRGRKDFIGMEKIGDYGGWSWTNVPNKFTKLQTERGTYYLEYLDPEQNPPKVIGNTGVKFKTWPSRDSILQMVREGARARGLDEHTMFNVEIQKITQKDNKYAIQWTPSNNDDADGGMQIASAVSAWPGFLHELNTVEWPGEEDFGGYIEYSSFDRYDYTRITGKKVVMYGHGAFTIENVRTLCEFRCAKVDIVCRTRNLCGTKMTSWLVGHNASPCPATVILDSFKRMFDLCGYDVWASPSVVTDKNRTFAYINQKTIFGVTDIYFLAGYYGLMECTVDEIKRCSYRAVHTRNKNKKIECDAVIKAIGTAPSWRIQKQLGIKQIVGSWANGDPLRPVNLSAKGVAAQNFASFSIGPGLAPAVKMLNWFIDYPEDWNLIKDVMPINKPGKWPCYVTDATYPTTMIMTVQSKIATLAAEMFEMDALKAAKTNQSHPVKEYLNEAKAEWEMYIKYFKEHGMVDNRPDPEYPYTVELMNEFDRRADESWARLRTGAPMKVTDQGLDNLAIGDDAIKPSKKAKASNVTVKTDSKENFTFGSQTTLTVGEVYQMVGEKIDMESGHALAVQDPANGMFSYLMDMTAECPSEVYLAGVWSMRPKRREYDHPIVVIGAGLGGVMCSIDLKHGRGRENFIILEKCMDFGGYSWIAVPNKFTKLQTERGTYYAEYLNPEASPPKLIGDGKVKYKTWPSRDSILQMTREGARARGLEEHTRFNTELQKISNKGDAYALQLTKSDGSEGGGVLMAGAVTSWVGFLHELNTCEWAGEDDFGGYMEYSSFDKFDYTQATGKRVVMYGHGAFTIENVRTLCEFRAKKVDVVCRYRNLCGTKMTSWLVGQGANPSPATVILDSFKQMFDLVGYDVWNCPSVKTNKKKSFALIEQKTIFGVTDIYFLAGYYGLMEVTVDEINRCSYHAVHTKNLNKKIECEVIIKAIGTAPSWKIQKQLGIKSVWGTWINNDPLRPVSLMSKGVNAQNFGTFSIGPGLASQTKMTNWFLDWPEDYEVVKAHLPQNKQDKWPLYVSEATYPMGMVMAVQARLPSLAMDMTKYDSIKAIKTSESHPLEEYLGECKREWEMYIKYFKDNNMVDDRPEPDYPYTAQMMKEFIRRGQEAWGVTPTE